MKLFWTFARQYFQWYAMYRFEVWLRTSASLLLMYGIRWVWITLYTQRPGVFNVSLEQMVTYGVLGLAVENIFYTGPQYHIARQVKTGGIDSDLLKPLDFHFHMLARSTGEMLVRIPVIVIPAFLCGYFFFGLKPPANSLAGSSFVVALLIGYLVNFHLSFLLGTLSLITLDIHSIDWAFNMSVRFFSGQLVPLWLFPGTLGVLAQVLPFQSMFYTPLSIYTGTFSGTAALQAIGFQLLWLAILLLSSRWLWGRVEARIVSQGG